MSSLDIALIILNIVAIVLGLYYQTEARYWKTTHKALKQCYDELLKRVWENKNGK